MSTTGAHHTTILIEFEDSDETHPSWGSALTSEQQQLSLRLTDPPAVIRLRVGERIILGRHTARGNQNVDIDLTPFQAVEKGVSRFHATLYRVKRTMYLLDMSSTNGTFLNGQRLVACKERIVRDGDEIRLGSLRMTIHFGSMMNL